MTNEQGSGGEFAVGELARACGVTVRTLHHYDRIGLLRPSGRRASGYRVYSDADLLRLQRILAYRELGFGLDDLAALLDGDEDPLDHLRTQHRLLSRRLEATRRMVATLEKTMEAHQMGIRLTPQEMLEVFGDDDPTGYADEARQRWGQSDAYRESSRRTSSYTAADWTRLKAAGTAIDDAFVAALQEGEPAGGARARSVARAHREYLTTWFYDVSPEVHRGLADMYLADPRFTQRYEQIAPGLAQYVHDAIHADAVEHAG